MLWFGLGNIDFVTGAWYRQMNYKSRESLSGFMDYTPRVPDHMTLYRGDSMCVIVQVNETNYRVQDLMWLGGFWPKSDLYQQV